MFPQTLVATPFAIMIPGQPSVFQFQLVSPNQYSLPLQNPALIPSIAFFLMNPIDENVAACLYFVHSAGSVPEFLGAVANGRPSEIFPTNFSLNPFTNTKKVIQLVVQLQPIDAQLQAQIAELPLKQNHYAMTIALHLEKFLQDYPKQVIQTNCQQMLAVPTIALDHWIKRFQEKFKIDPNFLYK